MILFNISWERFLKIVPVLFEEALLLPLPEYRHSLLHFIFASFVLWSFFIFLDHVVLQALFVLFLQLTLSFYHFSHMLSLGVVIGIVFAILDVRIIGCFSHFFVVINNLLKRFLDSIINSFTMSPFNDPDQHKVKRNNVEDIWQERSKSNWVYDEE